MAFMIVGPALMMLNKYILQDLHFDHPMSLCSFGVVSSAIVAHLVVACGLGRVREESMQLMAGGAWFKIAMPIGLMKAMTMSSGNAVYMYLSFGFIQMLKAFTPLIVLLVMRTFGVKLPTRAALWCVLGIVCGTVIEVHGELHATAAGLVLMLASEFFEAVSVVLSQRILQNNKFSVLEGMYFTAPAGGLCLLTGAMILEAPDMVRTGHHRIPLDNPRIFMAAAMLGVAINFISFLVMQLTSALTMKILNTARSVGLVAVGVLFYGEYHPPRQLCGYGLALLGFAGYNAFNVFPEAAKSVESYVDGVLARACLCCPKRLRGCWRRVDTRDGSCQTSEMADNEGHQHLQLGQDQECQSNCPGDNEGKTR